MKSQKIHTDLLEELFGKIHIEILSQSDTLRVVNICDSAGVSRTHAISAYTYKGNDQKILSVINEIKSGGSIGKTVKKYNFIFEKVVEQTGQCYLNKELQKHFAVRDTVTSFRTYKMFIGKQSSNLVPFMKICEVLTPLIQGEIKTKSLKKYSYQELVNLVRETHLMNTAL